jgi:outer membrane receptor protein involved in Fe transport
MTQMRKSSRFLWVVCLFFAFAQIATTQTKEKKDPFEMSFEELMKVKIKTAGKTQEQIGNIPASVVLITRKDIETFGYTTLAEILENIPGLYATDDYSLSEANFGIRGFWYGEVNKNIIILVNGVPQIYDYIASYPLVNSPIPVEAIDRIEVVRGPMSVIYGTGAFFGVINIFTDDASTDSLNIASVSAGSEKTGKLFLRLEGGEGDFHYAVNASIYDTYGIDEPLSKMMTNPEILPIAFKVPVDQRTGGQLEDNQKYINFSGRYKGIYIDLTYNENSNEMYINFPSYSQGSEAQWSSTRVLVGYRKKFSDAFTIDGKVNYCQTQLWINYDYLTEDFYGLQRNYSKAIEGELDAFIKPSKNLDLKTGLYYRAVLDTSNMVDLPSFNNPGVVNNYFYLADGNDIVTRAFFAQVTFAPMANVELVGGVRLEQVPKYKIGQFQYIGPENVIKVEGTYNEDNVEIIPRFALIYSLNDKNIVKLLYGKAINRPSFFQNTKNTLDPLRDDLQPEWIETLELNYISALSPKITLNSSVFLNTLRNLVTRLVVVGPNYQSWFANAGKMVTKGIELTLQAKPLKNFSMEMSGTYQETEDKRPGYEHIETAYSPKFLGYLKAAYRAKNFTLAVTGNYVGEMETLWDEAIANPDGTYGNRIGQKVPGYFNMGANLRIEDILLKGVYLNLRVSNILDSEIRYPTYTTNQWANRGTLGHSRFFMLSLGYKF